MPFAGLKRFLVLTLGFCLVAVASSGCESTQQQVSFPDNMPAAPAATAATAATVAESQPVEEHKQRRPDLPHELSMVSLPTYVIESPDVLLIDAVRLVPLPPYHVKPLDVLGLEVTNTLPTQPIQGFYTVDADGTIFLGPAYGRVQVEGLEIGKVEAAIENQLKLKLQQPFEVRAALVDSRAMQQIRGPHLVEQDGTIRLGTYGSVYVDSMTLDEARKAIQDHLAVYMKNPEISLDVQGFNSKVYYVITDGAGFGEAVARLPITGKISVLDALSQVNGLGPVSSKQRVFLVRPTVKDGHADEEVYRIDWNAVVNRGSTVTNYQVFPGDRIVVKSEPLVTFNNYLTRILNPFNQALGVVGLGDATVRQFQTPIATNGLLTQPGF
jgi:polysaccharide export outer membrane protein